MSTRTICDECRKAQEKDSPWIDVTLQFEEAEDYLDGRYLDFCSWQCAASYAAKRALEA